MGIITPLIYLCLAICAPARQITDLREVDFKNFAYPFSDKHFVEKPELIQLKDGKYEGPPSEATKWWGVNIANVAYGDLTGDAREEAAVVITYSSGAMTYFLTDTYIYTLRAGRPRLLGVLKESRIEKDYVRLSAKRAEMKYEAVSGGRQIKDHTLRVEHFAGGSHAMPEHIITLRYRWDGKTFVLAGRLHKRAREEKDKIL